MTGSESHPDSPGQGKKSQGFQIDSGKSPAAQVFRLWTRFGLFFAAPGNCDTAADHPVPTTRPA